MNSTRLKRRADQSSSIATCADSRFAPALRIGAHTPFICLRFIPLPLLLCVITSFIIHCREPLKSGQENKIRHALACGCVEASVRVRAFKRWSAGFPSQNMERDFTIANDYDPDGDMSASADPMTRIPDLPRPRAQRRRPRYGIHARGF